MKELEWSPRALRGLFRVWDFYLRNVSEESAVRVVDEINAAVDLLRGNPLLGRSATGRARRELVVEDYILTYEVKRTSVRVIKVEHGKQRK